MSRLVWRPPSLCNVQRICSVPVGEMELMFEAQAGHWRIW